MQQYIYNNQAAELIIQNKYDDALLLLDKALELDPNYTDASYNKACVLQELGSYHKALEILETIQKQHPSYGAINYALGQLLIVFMRLNEALDVLAKVPKSSPTYTLAVWAISNIKLMKGEFSEGWQLYEKRIEIPIYKNLSLPNIPFWNKENLKDKTIFVYPEQGYGDLLQMCRYVNLLKEQADRVIFGVPPEMKSLMLNLESETEITAYHVNTRIDYQVPIMSLPAIFNMNEKNVPYSYGYLKPSKSPIKLEGDFKVGLCWQGGKRAECAAVNARRNLSIEQLNKLKIDGITFYSLQKEGEVPNWIINSMVDVKTFDDTASIICGLDLVISVDTSTAHLAGALGKPVWLLNRFDTCWRWMIDRNDSPWYESMRIFRQSALGAWDLILNEVKHELEKEYHVTKLCQLPRA